MRGIDIYHGDSINETSKLKSVPEKAYTESDFVIVKATQGVSYKYTSFFDAMIKRVLDDGKLAGAYHYAAGNDAKAEADYFIKIVKPYLGKIVLCLDWEGNQNKKFGNKTWCTTFINRVKEKTGITCILYTGTDGCKQNTSLAGKVPLWFAGYPKPMKTGWTVPAWKYDLGVWGFCDIWQYTSTNEKCDRNTTEMTAKEWKSLMAPCYPTPDRHLQLLAVYHEYIKKHYKKIVNKYDSDVKKYYDMKKLIKAGKQCGITCVVPDRFALFDMGIKGYGGKSLISTEDGTFGKYYAGNVKTLFTRITKGSPIGMTVKQAVDKGLLNAADILCYEDLTHISVYSGKGYTMYEGGGGCVKDRHYPDGITKDYSNYGRKISEILRWKTDISVKKETETKKTTEAAATVKVTKSANNLVKQAQSWIGCKESDGTHKKIIDLYNSHKPLARGYKVKYTDSWCATFVSACAIACGYTDIIPLECSCVQLVELAKKKGIWVENENRTPNPGDIILYDWQDSGSGDNKGAPDHVGIVEKTDGNTITVIEGNYGDAVKRRALLVNGKYIRGYICPKYADAKTSTTTTTPVNVLPQGRSKTNFTLSGTRNPSKRVYMTGKVTAGALNVRTWAGTGHPNIKKCPVIKKGTKVGVCDAILDDNKSTWYYIKIKDKYYGFVSAKHVIKT